MPPLARYLKMEVAALQHDISEYSNLYIQWLENVEAQVVAFAREAVWN